MTKDERVPSSEIKRVTRTYHGRQKKINWRGLSITVIRLLSVQDLMSLIDDIIRCCTTTEDDENVLNYAILDLSMRFNIIKKYTNIDMPEDLNEAQFVLYETDLFDVVCTEINKSQLDSIIKAINF